MGPRHSEYYDPGQSPTRSRPATHSTISIPVSIHRLDDDTLRQTLGLLDVRGRCVASCVCSRWNWLLNDVPDSHLALQLENVEPRLFPGFESWLLRRLQGPLARELATLHLSISGNVFAAHQLRICEALGGCSALTELRFWSTTCYSEFDWGGVAALPPSLQTLEIRHFNLPFLLNARGEREVMLQGLDRLTQLRTLRISCMPLPHHGFTSDELWRIVVATSLTRLRQLQYLEVAAAFGEFRPDFGLPPSLSSLTNLTELRMKVNNMSAASMAAVAHLQALRTFRLQVGPPCLPLTLGPLARAPSLRTLSVAFDMRARGIDPAQVPPGTQVPVMFDLSHLPQIQQLRVMIFPDNPEQPSNKFQVHFAAGDLAALARHQLQLLDLRLANATAVMSLEVLVRLAALRQLRVQAGVMDLQPPFNADGMPSYRGAAGHMSNWVHRIQDLHLRCDRATTKTSAALQAFEMLDADCIYDCRAGPADPAAAAEGSPAHEQQHLWKGDVNSASIAAWGLEA